MTSVPITRRDFLSAALLVPAALRLQGDARLVGTVPLGTLGGRQAPPFGRLLGAGLDARLFTDLSTLSASSPDALVTPNDRFFVRTACPPMLGNTDSWTLDMGGAVQAPVKLTLPALDRLVRSGGRFLSECSGNVDQSNYGLMSVANWEGVPMAQVLALVRPAADAHRVLVSGVDDTVTPARTSVPGASWIFTHTDLERAILATRMNGVPLPRDHGFPVRLIVPGWYGCASIKWVNRIDLVPDDALATTQMREFAARTHQPFTSPEALESLRAGTALARDFAPAVIDTAAMPIRVEKWTAGGHLTYRVIGIIWGGSEPTTALAIRFKAGDPWVPVEDCPRPASTLAWSLWSHTWTPESPGRYQIVLKVTDPAIRTKRLDLFFYVREVQIDEV